MKAFLFTGVTITSACGLLMLLTPAHAGLSVNGLSSNGLAINGLSSNGLSVNGLPVQGSEKFQLNVEGGQLVLTAQVNE